MESEYYQPVSLVGYYNNFIFMSFLFRECSLQLFVTFFWGELFCSILEEEKIALLSCFVQASKKKKL